MKNILFLLLLLGMAAGLNAQCISINNCPATQPVCDFSPNDFSFWNNNNWLDPLNQTSDLPESAASISASATDTCTNAILSVKYLLFLDLNNDSILETVIKSWNPPAPGLVYYNNINNPNYEGGDTLVFDARPVPTGNKYQFALETTTSGNTLTGKLRWNTPNAPNTFVNVQLPYGTSKIKWTFEDNLANTDVCEYIIPVADCKAPTVVCLNGLSINIMPTGQITVWASDFLQYAEDNATPSAHLEYGVRKTDAGSGFPEDSNGNPVLSVTFDCNELGTQFVELWARDASGNADYCQTYIIVQDNAGNCSGSGGTDEAPTVICLNGVSIQLSANGTVSIPASSLLNAVYDNNTPVNLLELGIRRSSTGTGFPMDAQGNPIQALLFETADLGVNSVEIWARDTAGNADYCETYLILEAYQGGSSNAPTLVCLNGLSVNLMPTGSVQLWATDFLQYVEDDNTPTGQIQLGIRKSGTGTGFPVDQLGNPVTSLVFSCNELGTQQIELWAIDQDGNTVYCETYLVVMDNLNNCGGPFNLQYTACVRRSCDNAIVTNVSLGFAVNSNFMPPFIYFTNPVDNNGCFHLDSVFGSIPIASNYTITPSKIDDDYNNGVTPLDLVKMARHILGLEPLSTYNMIAADANKSGSITTLDIVELRKTIQGIYSELPNNTSWRFVDANYSFTNPNNPFQEGFPESETFFFDSTHQSNFIAIKIGDVDCDAHPGAIATPDDRQIQYLSIQDAVMEAGETLEIPLSFTEAGAWLAIQAGFSFNPEQLEIEAIEPGNLPGLEKASFASPAPGVSNLVWYTSTPYAVAAGENIGTLRIHARKALRLSEAIQLARRTPETPGQIQASGYDAKETAYNFQLLFHNKTAETRDDQNLIFQAQPNPTAASSAIPVQLTKPETLRLTVSDMNGQTLWQQSYALPQGLHMLEIPEAVMPKSGVYRWQVLAGETTGSGKLVRMQ